MAMAWAATGSSDSPFPARWSGRIQPAILPTLAVQRSVVPDNLIGSGDWMRDLEHIRQGAMHCRDLASSSDEPVVAAAFRDLADELDR